MHLLRAIYHGIRMRNSQRRLRASLRNWTDIIQKNIVLSKKTGNREMLYFAIHSTDQLEATVAAMDAEGLI